MIIRFADCARQPWKNGLGSTREIAVYPQGCGSDYFLWRASLAEVDSAAPFSRFAGIDRHIALLDGAGFTMTLDQHQQHALTTPFAPFAFAGEANVQVTLVDGATRDFNLMVRREQARGDMQAWHGPTAYKADPATALVFCARGEIETIDGRLAKGDAWRPSASANDAVTLQKGAIALVILIQAHPA